MYKLTDAKRAINSINHVIQEANNYLIDLTKDSILEEIELSDNQKEQLEQVLFNIKDQLSRIPLTQEGIPEIINPFANLPEPTLGPVSQLPPVVTGANPTVMNANQRLIPGDFNSLTQAQKYEILFGGN